MNFLAALAARKRCNFRLLLHLSNSIFKGFPLSQVSVVLPSANNVVNAFFCFVLSPIVAVAKTQLFRPTLQNLDAKVTYQSSFLHVTSAILSRHLSTSMQHLHSSCWTTFSNEQFIHLHLLQWTSCNIYETDILFQNWRGWHGSNPTYVTSFQTNYLKLALFTKIDHTLMNRRIDNSRKNRDEETK